MFIGTLSESDKWEIRLQIVRALPLFEWTAAQARRVEQILRDSVSHPQTFVRAWALDSLASFAERRATFADECDLRATPRLEHDLADLNDRLDVREVREVGDEFRHVLAE